MTPIQHVLSRIRWDPGFAQGQIEIGYLDRVERRIISVPLKQVRFPEDRRGVLEVTDPEGLRHRIPLHRVREVLRDGQALWSRPQAATGAPGVPMIPGRGRGKSR